MKVAVDEYGSSHAEQSQIHALETYPPTVMGEMMMMKPRGKSSRDFNRWVKLHSMKESFSIYLPYQS